MSQPYLDVEGAHNAARRLESAAHEANRAADRMEEVIREFRILTDHGYGNNVCTLIELLQGLDLNFIRKNR